MKLLLALSILIVATISSFAQSDTTGIRTTILKETKSGGKLDFFTPIKGHEYDGVQIKPGLYSTKLGVAFINWGKSVRNMGVQKLDEAYSIFSQHKGRDLNEREKEYIKLGFNEGVEN